MRGLFCLAWGLAAGMLVGCGPDAALSVWVGAPLSVPEACDAVHVTATRVKDGIPLYDSTRDLVRAAAQFPLTFNLTTSDAGNFGVGSVRVSVEALHAGGAAASWAHASATADVLEGKVTSVRLELCDCVP